MASQASDSLRYALDADATPAERAEALCRYARRSLEHDLSMAMAHADRAEELARQAGRTDLQHDALTVLRVAQLRAGLAPEHLATTLRCLDLARELGDGERVTGDLQELSQAYHAQSQMGQAVEHARKALAVTLPLRDAAAIARAHAFLLEALAQAGQHDQVLREAESAMGRSEALPPIEQARLRLTIARAHIGRQRFGDAQPNLAAAGRVLLEAGSPDDRFAIHLAQAQVAIGTGRLADAQRHLQEAGAQLGAARDPKARIRWIMEQRALAAAKGDWRRAHDLLLDARAAEDSAHTAMRQLVFDGIRMAHDLEATERDRSALQERHALAESAITSQREGFRVLLAAAALLLALAVALLLMVRAARRAARRGRLKAAVIERQRRELHERSLELQRQNMRLAEALQREERQGLALGEMHHRLKNNLQAIDALLRMQGGALPDPALRRVLADAQGRLRAMALVHATIYRLGDDSELPVEDHLHELARNILVAFGRHDRISVLIDADPVRLHANALLPLSLIVNELITNTLKHGISEGAHGAIRMVLRSVGESIELRYSDDGAPGARGQAPAAEHSFGLELMRALAQQLDGSLTVQHGLCDTWCLAFTPERAALRKAS